MFDQALIELLHHERHRQWTRNDPQNSRKEQGNACLNQCSDQEFIEFKKLNVNYKKKFGFPFIVAVKGKKKEEILENFRQRFTNDTKKEFNEAKEQVKKIATFRLEEIIN